MRNDMGADFGMVMLIAFILGIFIGVIIIVILLWLVG